MNSKVLVAIFSIIILGLAGFLYFAHPQNRVDGTDTPQKEIKIGALVALTGDAASYGQSSRNVLELAADEINHQGGINGLPIKFIYADSKCSAKEGFNAAQKLIMSDKVKIIIGASCSSENLAAIPLINSNRVILFSPTATTPELTNRSPYFFRNHPSDDEQGNVMADFVYNNKNWKKIAILIEKADYPTGVYSAFKTTFEQLGGTVFKEEFAPNITEYRFMLTKLKSENPDALFLDVNTPVSLERVLKQLNDLNWKPPLILLDSSTSNAEIVKTLQNELEGALSAEFKVDSNNPKYQHLLKAYKEKYGVDLPYPTYMQDVYDSVYLIKDGITKVGLNPDQLAAWSRTIRNWEGASGKVTINQKGERVGGHTIKIIKNGQTYDYSEE